MNTSTPSTPFQINDRVFLTVDGTIGTVIHIRPAISGELRTGSSVITIQTDNRIPSEFIAGLDTEFERCNTLEDTRDYLSILNDLAKK